MKRNKDNIFTAIDLFSGAGGTTLGLKRAGFKVLGAVDLDSVSVESYKLNHPEVYVWEDDIKNLEIKEIKKTLKLRKGELDLLIGCPPCQGFTNIRNDENAGSKDERNDLVFEFIRFVEGLKPKTIMLENVPGLHKDKRLDIVKNSLIELGYNFKYKILNAADYGVPQRRRRFIMIGIMKKVEIDFASPNSKRLTVGEILKPLKKAGSSGDVLHDLLVSHREDIQEIIKMIPKNGGGRADLDESYKLECHKKCKGFTDVYARMRWNDVAPTITGGCISPSKGRFLHPMENRAITLREASLLQGFPINYKFSLTKGRGAVAKMIGNALPPEFIKRHALILRKALKKAYG